MQDEESQPTIGQLVVSLPGRMVLYGLIMGVVFQVVYLLLQSHGARWLSAEQGLLEMAQVGCLLVAAMAIGTAAWWAPVGRAALVAAGAASIYAAARESDEWFEAMLFDDAYKWLVGLPLLGLVIAFAYHQRKRLVRETLRISQYPGAVMFTMAGILLCVFCQMLDRPFFWPIQGQNVAAGLTKLLVEESTELFAYLMIVFSGLEAMISARADRASMAEAEKRASRRTAHGGIDSSRFARKAA